MREAKCHIALGNSKAALLSLQKAKELDASCDKAVMAEVSYSVYILTIGFGHSGYCCSGAMISRNFPILFLIFCPCIHTFTRTILLSIVRTSNMLKPMLTSGLIDFM